MAREYAPLPTEGRLNFFQLVGLRRRGCVNLTRFFRCGP